MAPSATADVAPPAGRNSPKPPPARIWSVSEPPFEGFKPIDAEGYARSNRETAIVIDNGNLDASMRSPPKALTAPPQGPPQSAQAGPSTRIPGCRSVLS
jgi:hypothetical protein